MSISQLIATVGTQQIATFFCVLARVGPLFVFAPVFSSKLVPLRARGVIAVALAIGLTPVARGSGKLPLDAFGLAGVITKELLVGLAFAFIIGALAAALGLAGAILDNLTGFSYGSLLDPVTGNNSSVIGQVYGLFGSMIFLAIGGEGWVIEGLARTYDAVGVTETPKLTSLVGGVTTAFTQILPAALEVCGPVVLAVVLADAAFGVVSRVVPQLNVFAIGLPFKIVIGLLLIGATLPFTATWIGDELQRDVSSAMQSVKLA